VLSPTACAGGHIVDAIAVMIAVAVLSGEE
jgi:hypothetical protein